TKFLQLRYQFTNCYSLSLPLLPLKFRHFQSVIVLSFLFLSLFLQPLVKEVDREKTPLTDVQSPHHSSDLCYLSSHLIPKIAINLFTIPNTRRSISVFRFPSSLLRINSERLDVCVVSAIDLERILQVNREMSLLPKSDSIQIREVWDDNLEEEFTLIRGIVDDFPYIAMDTEFPGIVLRPVGNFKNSNDYHYQTLKDNVDMLKLIQLGLTFSDKQGNLPTCGTDKHCIWQFNFREFNVNDDVFANDSVELLRESGIDFKKNNEKGIDARRFGELLMSSGIVLNDNVYWVTFHSGYDFGYLLKVLTCKNLPDTQAGFFSLINMYFPTIYDIKHLMKFCNSLHGGLNKLAELLEVERVGVCHQAGSDSLLTSCTFRKLKENFFSGSLEKYAGVLYGLGVEN
ncbi:hypothetical protein Ccrd_015581, partial [Cynara cardunculus var. scolymus]